MDGVKTVSGRLKIFSKNAIKKNHDHRDTFNALEMLEGIASVHIG